MRGSIFFRNLYYIYINIYKYTYVHILCLSSVHERGLNPPPLSMPQSAILITVFVSIKYFGGNTMSVFSPRLVNIIIPQQQCRMRKIKCIHNIIYNKYVFIEIHHRGGGAQSLKMSPIYRRDILFIHYYCHSYSCYIVVATYYSP